MRIFKSSSENLPVPLWLCVCSANVFLRPFLSTLHRENWKYGAYRLVSFRGSCNWSSLVSLLVQLFGERNIRSLTKSSLECPLKFKVSLIWTAFSGERQPVWRSYLFAANNRVTWHAKIGTSMSLIASLSTVESELFYLWRHSQFLCQNISEMQGYCTWKFLGKRASKLK